MAEKKDGAKRNNGAGAGSDAARRREPRPDYASGNKNWNNERYHKDVRTDHTKTKVLNSFITPLGEERGSYYYDNTPDAVRARRKANFDERREKWREEIRKNRRRYRVGRRFLSFIIILAAVLGAASVVYKLFFVASDITVVGAVSYTPEEIVGAAGLDGKTNLFSFSSRAAGARVRFYCPRVSETSFDRTIPNKVEITVDEEVPTYYADVYGEPFAISDSLRVLGRIEETETEGLIKLKLQTVTRAISGSKIELLSERAAKFLDEVTGVISSSPLKERLTTIDLTNDFNIEIVAEHKYLLFFGSEEDFEIKVRLASAILEDDLFKTGIKAIINLEDTEKTSVIRDNQLVLD